MDVVSYDDIMKAIGFGRVQFLLLITAGILNMMPLNETMGMAMIVVAAKCDFKMNVNKIAITTTAPFLGMITSAFFWGYLSDSVGRRKILIITTFCSTISSIISILMPRYWLFVCARFLTGIFLSGPASIPITYLSEFCTVENSSQVINWMAAFTGLSMIYCPTIGLFLLTTKWAIPVYGQYKFTPWRLQIILYTLPGFIGALILFALPESPNYLIAVGKEREGAKALNWLCIKSTGKPLSSVLRRGSSRFRLRSTINMKEKDIKLRTFWEETIPIFRKPIVVNFLLSCCMMFGLLFIANGMGIWYPTIRGFHRHVVNETGFFEGGRFCDTFFISKYDPFSENKERVKCTSVKPEGALDSIILGITYLICFTFQGISLHFIGRKKTMMAVFVTSCICIMVITLIHIENIHVLLAIFCMFLSLPAISISMLASGVVHFTPTRQRAKAVCLVAIFGRSGAVVGTYTFLVLFDEHCDILILIGLVYYMGVAVLYILPLE